jgi:hypothetical protein
VHLGSGLGLWFLAWCCGPGAGDSGGDGSGPCGYPGRRASAGCAGPRRRVRGRPALRPGSGPARWRAGSLGGGVDGPARHWRRLGWGWLLRAGQAGERGYCFEQQRVDAVLLVGGAAGAELGDRAVVPGLGGELAARAAGSWAPRYAVRDRFLRLGSVRWPSCISRSAPGDPSSSSRLRSDSALNSAPRRSATLVIHNHTRNTTTPPRAP